MFHRRVLNSGGERFIVYAGVASLFGPGLDIFGHYPVTATGLRAVMFAVGVCYRRPLRIIGYAAQMPAAGFHGREDSHNAMGFRIVTKGYIANGAVRSAVGVCRGFPCRM